MVLCRPYQAQGDLFPLSERCPKASVHRHTHIVNIRALMDQRATMIITLVKDVAIFDCNDREFLSTPQTADAFRTPTQYFP